MNMNNAVCAEDNYFEMSETNISRRCQIPIRGNRFDYLMNWYNPGEKECKWIMFHHKEHFLIYDKESRKCLLDLVYLQIKDLNDESIKEDDIVAVITEYKVNRDEMGGDEFPDILNIIENL